MGQKSSVPEDTLVVVVGGGYGGANLALALMKDGANFILIDSRDTHHHNLASVRAMAVPGLAKKTFLPLEHTFRGHFRCAKVIDVDPAAKVVKLEGGDEVSYDVLVLATGTSGPFPCKLQDEDTKTAIAKYEAHAQRVKNSSKIVVVGGGAAGVEVAGEVATEYPDKEVTIVHSGLSLVSPKLSAKLLMRLDTLLKELRIKVILGVKVTNLHDLEGGNGPVVTSDGQTIDADLVITCTGVKVNTDAYTGAMRSATDPRGALRVNPHLQLADHPDIFALGDCAATGDGWFAYKAYEHATLVHHNIARHLKGQALASHKPEGASVKMGLSVGRHRGIGQLGSGMALPEFLIKMVKSKDLMVKRRWGELKQNPPK